MSNALYDKGRDAFLQGSITWNSDTVKMALVSSAYTVAISTHQYYSDVPSTAVIGTPVALSSKSSSAGIANCGNVTFTSVTTGSTVSYIVIYKDTGTDTTSPLIAYIDTATGLPVTTNGGNITVTIDTGAAKLFKL